MDSPGTRVCFFVNTNIEGSSWRVTHHLLDYATLYLKVRIGQDIIEVQIHNVYNPPSPVGSEPSNTLLEIQQRISSENPQIILGDFNLYHPLWSDSLDYRTHDSAEMLIQTIDQHGLTLALPRGTITRERGENMPSTLDLVFISNSWIDNLLKCRVAEELDHDSDHYPIETVLDFAIQTEPETQRRAWKRLNHDCFIVSIKNNLPDAENLNCPREIDNFTEKLAQAINNAINVSTPWTKLSRYSKSYWTDQCTAAVKSARKAKRLWKRLRTDEAWEAYKRARNHKRSILRRHKTEEHRQRVEEAASSGDGIWKIAKWAKIRSSKQASCRRFPLIQADGQIATDTNDKINLFKQAFFPEPPSPNLRDLEGYIYPPSIEVPDITTREIEEAIRRASPKKAPGTDGIPNHILQRAAPIITPHLTRLLRASLP